MFRTLADAWPARRRAAAALLMPVMAVWFVVAADSADTSPAVAWYALAMVAAALAAGVLASYVPLSGRKPDLGCTPCAAMSALTVLGATIAVHNYGADLAGPLVASGVLLSGLAQRMNQPATCAA